MCVLAGRPTAHTGKRVEPQQRHPETPLPTTNRQPQDLKDAMSVEELTGSLSLHSIRSHDWHIQVRARAAASTGTGRPVAGQAEVAPS